MKLNRRNKNLQEDSAALSDLAFILIIYFIVIAGFTVNKGFLMNLPAKGSTRFILREDLLRFELTGSGTLLYRGETIDRVSAGETIRAAINSRPNLALILTIDPLTPWQQVVSFVELARNLEVDSFSFAIKEAP
jgi:biopolymer transport protein ExbD